MDIAHQSEISVHVTLSERNLRTLLNKLEDPASKRTLYRDTEHGRLIVTAEPNSDHYSDRKPGGVLHAPDDDTRPHPLRLVLMRAQEDES